MFLGRTSLQLSLPLFPVILSQGLNKTGKSDQWAMLTSGYALPLDEDWCFVEWSGWVNEYLRGDIGRVVRRKVKR